MPLSRLEQETIINFNEAEATATVRTYNKRLLRRLEKLHTERDGEVSKNSVGDYVIPKSWVKVNPKREATEKQRQHLEQARSF